MNSPLNQSTNPSIQSKDESILGQRAEKEKGASIEHMQAAFKKQLDQSAKDLDQIEWWVKDTVFFPVDYRPEYQYYLEQSVWNALEKNGMNPAVIEGIMGAFDEKFKEGLGDVLKKRLDQVQLNGGMLLRDAFERVLMDIEVLEKEWEREWKSGKERLYGGRDPYPEFKKAHMKAHLWLKNLQGQWRGSQKKFNQAIEEKKKRHIQNESTGNGASVLKRIEREKRISAIQHVQNSLAISMEASRQQGAEYEVEYARQVIQSLDKEVTRYQDELRQAEKDQIKRVVAQRVQEGLNEASRMVFDVRMQQIEERLARAEVLKRKMEQYEAGLLPKNNPEQGLDSRSLEKKNHPNNPVQSGARENAVKEEGQRKPQEERGRQGEPWVQKGLVNMTQVVEEALRQMAEGKIKVNPQNQVNQENAGEPADVVWSVKGVGREGDPKNVQGREGSEEWRWVKTWNDLEMAQTLNNAGRPPQVDEIKKMAHHPLWRGPAGVRGEYMGPHAQEDKEAFVAWIEQCSQMLKQQGGEPLDAKEWIRVVSQNVKEAEDQWTQSRALSESERNTAMQGLSELAQKIQRGLGYPSPSSERDHPKPEQAHIKVVIRGGRWG